MDNKRIFLWAAVGLLLWVNFLAWQRDYPQAPVAAVAPSTTAAERSTELPALPQSSTQAPAAANVPAQTATPSSASAVRVRTDVMDVLISTQGGEIRETDLLKYPKEKNDPNTPIRLINDESPHVFLARSGLLSTQQQQAPTHLTVYQAENTEYQLPSDANDLPVKLTWTNNDGITVVKTFTFHRGSYVVDLSYEVNNQSAVEWQAASYVQLFRHHEPMEYSMFNPESYAYRGPAIFDGKAYRKLNLKDKENHNFQATLPGGWIAAMQHHFVVAAVPPLDQSYDYKLALDSGNDFTLSYRGPLRVVPSGGTGTFTEKLFIGPKIQSQLITIHPQLDRTADYGKLWIIARPLFLLLGKVHEYVGNWGWAIILVTFIIKLAFYKLTAASGRSMAKMRNLTPRIKAIQDRYKDDREQLGRAMMEIYKKEKINPLAGCLPIFIQIPVFMGFYWVLLESVEMRQAPFLGWINDLSSRDPFFILPIIMGIANFVQFKLNPAPPDPMQAKVFAFMPLVMTVMMAWFPSGMVLYWITNTVLSALQQWRINKVIAADNKRATA